MTYYNENPTIKDHEVVVTATSGNNVLPQLQVYNALMYFDLFKK